MDNQWITLEAAAALSGRSISMLRKLAHKNKIGNKLDNHRLTINKQSIITYYKLTNDDPKPADTASDDNRDTHGYEPADNMGNHGLAKRYAVLQDEHINMKEKLNNEKMKLADQLIEMKQTQLEGYKKYDDIVVQKDETIHQKNDIIEQHQTKHQKKNLIIVVLLFLLLLAIGSLILFILFNKTTS